LASLTNIMTSTATPDANLDLDEESRIEAADVDTLRHSKSRLPVGTRLTRGEALLLRRPRHPALRGRRRPLRGAPS